MEDVPGGLGGTCGKGNRRRVDQHSQKDVALRCLKEQLDVIPRQNPNYNQGDNRHGSLGAYTQDDGDDGIAAVIIQGGMLLR